MTLILPNQGIAIPFAPGTGQKAQSLPIALCTEPDKNTGSRVVRVDIPWTQDPYLASWTKRNVAVSLDLIGMAVQTPLDAIRFCKIDNSFNDVPVYVVMDDTGDLITCPPNSIVGVQVQSRNQKLTVYGVGFFTGRTPITSFYFSNVPQDPYYIPGASAFEAIGAFIDQDFQTSAGILAWPIALKTGPADAGRVIVVATFSRRAANAVNTATSLVLNGINFTAIFNQSYTFLVGGRFWNMGLWYAVVPTGGVANGLLTFPNNQDVLWYGAWRISNLQTTAPFSSDSDINLNVATLPQSVIPGSFSVWGGIASQNTLAAADFFPGVDVFQDYWSNGTAGSASAVGFASGDGKQPGVLSYTQRAEYLFGATWI